MNDIRGNLRRSILSSIDAVVQIEA